MCTKKAPDFLPPGQKPQERVLQPDSVFSVTEATPRPPHYPCIFPEVIGTDFPQSSSTPVSFPQALPFMIPYSRETCVLGLALGLAFTHTPLGVSPAYQNLKMMPVATRTMMMDMVIVT